MTTKTNKTTKTIKEKISMVDVRLPNPLPSGLKVVYWKESGGYTLAATSKKGIRNLLELGFAGKLG